MAPTTSRSMSNASFQDCRHTTKVTKHRPRSLLTPRREQRATDRRDHDLHIPLLRSNSPHYKQALRTCTSQDTPLRAEYTVWSHPDGRLTTGIQGALPDAIRRQELSLITQCTKLHIRVNLVGLTPPDRSFEAYRALTDAVAVVFERVRALVEMCRSAKGVMVEVDGKDGVTTMGGVGAFERMGRGGFGGEGLKFEVEGVNGVVQMGGVNREGLKVEEGEEVKDEVEEFFESSDEDEDEEEMKVELSEAESEEESEWDSDEEECIEEPRPGMVNGIFYVRRHGVLMRM